MKTLFRLKPRSGVMKDFYVFDTETKIYNPQKKLWYYGLMGRPESLCFGVVYSHNYMKVLETPEQFQEEFKHHRYKNKVVFAHNASYDLNVVYGNIYELDPKAIFNGKFISATNGNCTFADSLNIYRYSVRDIGKFLGLEKDVLNMSDGTKTKNEYSENDLKYCIRDCEVVYNALLDIFDTAGAIKITQASIALTYYRRYFQPHHIEYNNQLTDHFFESYYGGRTEVFQLGKTDSYVIDINSMYPDSMRNSLFPNPKYLKKINNISVKRFLKNYLYVYEGMVSCTVYHNDEYFGHLPVRIKNKLCFPIGKFSGSWNFNELRYAIDSGVVEILDIDYFVYGREQESIFKDFVDTLYPQKQNAENDLIKTRTKLFLNSLYGKFAQKINIDYEYLSDVNDHISYIQDLQEKKLLIEIQLFNEDRFDCFLVKKSLVGKSINHSIASYASYITSHARIRILKELKKYKDHTPVYCDTDSIFLEKKPSDIVDSDELGAWKIENKKVTMIRGLKNYDYIKNGRLYSSIKGIPRNAEKIGEGIFSYITLIGIKEGLRRNKKAGTPEKRIKELKGTYDKRIVLKDLKTKPIKL